MHKYKFFIAYGNNISIHKEYDYPKLKALSSERQFFWEGYQKDLFDGVLISKAVISNNLYKKIQSMGGVHNYLKIDKHLPVMADNGAYTHIKAATPQSTPEEIFNYFVDLKFTSGITLDHIITQFSIENNNPTEDMIYRQNITIENARKMYEMNQKTGNKIELYAAIQGWDVKSMRYCIEEMANIGYKHIAIGGIAAKQSDAIITMFNGIRDVVKKHDLKIHVLGCIKTAIARFLSENNVISGDSTSYMKFAVKDFDNGMMCPIEKRNLIPFLPIQLSVEGSQSILQNLLDYQNKEIDIKTLSNKIKNYLEINLRRTDWFLNKTVFDRLIKSIRQPMWEVCGCPACKELGVFMFVARTFQYNTKRAFHNQWNHYHAFVKAQTTNLETHKLKSFLGA